MKKRIRMYKVQLLDTRIQQKKLKHKTQTACVQGTTIQWEHKLPDVPCAVQSFYHEAGRAVRQSESKNI